MPPRSQQHTHLAKQLRKNATEAETKLWRHLRSRQLNGLKFRRQYVIKPYIVDFCCIDEKLIVECDGGQHLEQEIEDQRRTDYLEKLGYQVKRYWNDEILLEIDGVLEDILQACG